MDISKLTPAPWSARETDVAWAVGGNGPPVLLAEEDNDVGRTAVKFACLARNAFDGDPEALAWWEANRRKR